MNLRYHDRVLVLGSTGSGKSELLNFLSAHVACQRVVVDTKDEFDLAGVEAVRGDPEAIDWRAPVVHYIDGGGGPDEFEQLFAKVYARQNVVVICHELSDLCEFQPGRTPRAVNEYLSKGRARGLGLLGGSQRPVNVPMRAKTEAQHVFIFPPQLSPDDHDAIARTVGLPAPLLGEKIDAARDELGPYSYLYWSREARAMAAYPALSESERATAQVARRVDV